MSILEEMEFNEMQDRLLAESAKQKRTIRRLGKALRSILKEIQSDHYYLQVIADIKSIAITVLNAKKKR